MGENTELLKTGQISLRLLACSGTFYTLLLIVCNAQLLPITGLAGDLITSDATVQWEVNWQRSTQVHVALPEFELQFDINQDGMADFTLNAATQLGSVDLAQHGVEDGPVHIKVRAKYHVESQNQVRLGPWKELAFVYGQDSTLRMMLKDSIALSNEQGSGTFLISTSRDTDEITGYWLDVDNDGDFDVALQHNATINGGVETNVDLRQVLGDEFSRIAQNGSYPISILVKDATGTYKRFATTLTVADATPIITFSTSGESIRGGESFSFMVNYEDAGPDPLQSVLIDWGDDSSTTLSPSVANATSVQGTHTYSESGAYWVTITVSNNDGNFETSYLILADESDEETPTNAPHLVEAYADVDVNGNATIVIQAVGASGELGVTMAWDLDGGGAFDDATGAQVSIQDDSNQHVFRATVRLSDSDGHETIEMFEFDNPFYTTFATPEVLTGGDEADPIRLSLLGDHRHHLTNRSLKNRWAEFLPGFDIDDFVVDAPADLHGATDAGTAAKLRSRGIPLDRGGAWNNVNLEFISRPEVEQLKGRPEGKKRVLEFLLKHAKAKGLDLSTMCTWQKAFTDKHRAEAIGRFLTLAADCGINPKDFPELQALAKQLLKTDYGKALAKAAFAGSTAARWFKKLLVVYIVYQVVTTADPQQAVAAVAEDLDVPIGAVRGLLSGEGVVLIDFSLINSPVGLPLTLKDGTIIDVNTTIDVTVNGKLIKQYQIKEIRSTGVEGIVDLYIERGFGRLPLLMPGMSSFPCACPPELLP